MATREAAAGWSQPLTAGLFAPYMGPPEDYRDGGRRPILRRFVKLRLYADYPLDFAASAETAESVDTSMAGFASGPGSVDVGGSVDVSMAGFAGGGCPHRPGRRTSMPAAFR